MSETLRPVALVSGGTRGIGRVLSEKLLETGYKVIATYRADEDSAEAFRVAHREHVEALKVDVRSSKAVLELVHEIEKTAPVSVAVCNAGVTVDRLAHQISGDDFANVFETNVGGGIHIISAVLPYMQKRKCGDIVVISSLAAHNVRPGNALYGASKAALERYCRTVAVEAIRFGIAVNMIAPGFVQTDMTDSFLDPAKRREILKSIPARRFTEMTDIADALKFLLSRRPLLVGATLPVGGGAHL